MIFEPSHHQVLSVLVLLAALSAVPITMMVRRQLDAQHSVAVLAAGGFVLLFLLWPGFRVGLMRLFGIGMPASAFFMIAVGVQGLVNVYLASRLTRITAQMRRLTQDMAALQTRVRDTDAACGS